MDQKNILDTKFYGPKFFWTLIFWTKIFYPLFLLDPKFYESKNILDQFFLVRVEVEQKLKWITSKTFMTNSGPFKTIRDPQRLLQPMLRLLHVILRDNFKDDFKTNILNSAQLGTTCPSLFF